jgi:K+-transporting ATPase ATPase A chain
MVSMMAGRFGLAVPALAIAGSLAEQRTRPVHAGTVPSEGSMFVAIVIAVSLLVGALTYFPVLALGPIVEHLALHR